MCQIDEKILTLFQNDDIIIIDDSLRHRKELNICEIG